MTTKLAIVVVLLCLLVLGIALLRRAGRRRRRARLRTQPFAEDWKGILERNLSSYAHLPADLKQQLHGHIHVFLNEKHFEGAGGLEITEEIKLTIAAQACLLLLNRETDYFRRLSSIIVYPSSYVATRTHRRGAVRVEDDEVLLGESWDSGTVTLAWNSVKHGAWDTKDGHNVVLHEFAHQLDQEDRDSDGAPILADREHCISWARVLSREYEKLQKATRRSRRTVLDKYGATAPAEFFAVATETFFEKPRQMKKNHPDLYDELRKYYLVDPVEWLTSRTED